MIFINITRDFYPLTIGYILYRIILTLYSVSVIGLVVDLFHIINDKRPSILYKPTWLQLCKVDPSYLPL